VGFNSRGHRDSAGSSREDDAHEEQRHGDEADDGKTEQKRATGTLAKILTTAEDSGGGDGNPHGGRELARVLPF
jgi:hypothetical protein